MTRINVGIHPSELITKMLIAEHREIKRIPNCVRSGRFSMLNQPAKFTLNTGHVKFFYDKLEYLRIRYELIYLECIRRNLKVQYFGNSFVGIDQKYMGNYSETKEDRMLVSARIRERILTIKSNQKSAPNVLRSNLSLLS